MVKRLRLTKQSEQLSAKIRCIPSYESNRINEERRFAISTLNERFFADIATDLEACFANCYITFLQEKEFSRYYTDYYKEADALVPQLKAFGIEPSEAVVKLIRDFNNIYRQARQIA